MRTREKFHIESTTLSNGGGGFRGRVNVGLVACAYINSLPFPINYKEEYNLASSAANNLLLRFHLGV